MTETNNSHPFFSVVIPVYNIGDYIERCLKSLMSQTYEDFEIIVVDDGSEDESGAICDRYAQRDSRIRTVHQENRGLPAARNAGMEIARGRYVVFVDGDDWVDPDMLEYLEHCARSGPDVIVISSMPKGSRGEALRRAFESNSVISGVDYFRLALEARALPVYAWAHTCRTQFLRESQLHFKEGILFEDLQFTPRMLIAANSVAHTMRSCYHYEQRPKSITTDRKHHDKAFRDICDTCTELERLCAPLGESITYPLGDLLVLYYLSGCGRTKGISFNRDRTAKGYVRARITSEAGLKTSLKARLFLLSPSLYRIVANTFINAKRIIAWNKPA